MRLREVRKLKKQLEDIDMEEIKRIQAKVEQDVAYATYDHNIYVSGFVHGLFWYDQYVE